MSALAYLLFAVVGIASAMMLVIALQNQYGLEDVSSSRCTSSSPSTSGYSSRLLVG